MTSDYHRTITVPQRSKTLWTSSPLAQSPLRLDARICSRPRRRRFCRVRFWTSPGLPRCAGLEVGARQVQNRGTIGGNLNTASPAADGVPPLLTLGAEVELTSATGTRLLPLSDYITGPRQVARRSDELLTAVILSDLAGEGSFLKLGARRYLVISVAMAAARLVITNGQVTVAAIAVGSCGPVAARLSKVEVALIGAPPDPALVQQTNV